MKLITMIITLCSFLPSVAYAVNADYSFVPVKGDGVAGYHIYYTEVSLKSTKLPAKLLNNPTASSDGRIHCEITNLKGNKDYLFTVAPIDANGVEGAFAAVLSFSTKVSTGNPVISMMTQIDAFRAKIIRIN